MLFTGQQCIYLLCRRFCRRFSSDVIKVSPYENENVVIKTRTNLVPEPSQDKQKALNIAILGAPNVGKSTLVNQITKRSVCPTSCKVHTTETKVNAMYIEGNTQLVFIDTPGLVTPAEFKQYSLNPSFREDPKKSIKAADVVGVVQDTSNRYTRHTINSCILDLLTEVNPETSIILILNKVDRLRRKNLLLDLVRVLTSKENWPNFQDVFMISALNGDGVDDLREYLLQSAKVKDWNYDPDMFTDQTPDKLIEKTVRAKLLDSLPQEVPYRLSVKLEHLETRVDGSLSSIVSIECASARIKSFVMGKGGSKIKVIAMQTEETLRNAFRTMVIVKICVKCKES